MRIPPGAYLTPSLPRRKQSGMSPSDLSAVLPNGPYPSSKLRGLEVRSYYSGKFAPQSTPNTFKSIFSPSTGIRTN
jgi:hypothetical protein